MSVSFLDVWRMTMDDRAALLRRKWYVLTPAIAGLVAGVIFWATQPKVYISFSYIIAEEARTPLPFFGSSVGRRISMIRDQIVDINNLVQVVDRLNLARELKTEKQYERLILGLRKRIAVRSRGENMFMISCRSGDPQEARAVVNVLDEMFVVRHGGAFSVYRRPQLPQGPAASNLAAAMAVGVFLGGCAGGGLLLFLKYKELEAGS